MPLNTRLDRTVALKVLPSALASDPEFKARFAIGSDLNQRQSISVVSHWFDELRARVKAK